MPADTRNPFVFVVGCPRSGTTLLQRMLDNHPDLAVANDTHFITRAARKVLRKNPNPALTPELVEQVRNYRRFYRMKLEEGDIGQAAGQSQSYAEFVSHLYTLRGQRLGKRLSGEKTPDYCLKIKMLNGLFPQARFVHIFRDGRETALSAMNWASENKGPGKLELWAEDPVACSALWWKWQTGTGLAQGRNLGARMYRELSYEDLVDDAPGKLESLADFLDIPNSEEMALYYKGKTKDNPTLSAKSAWLPPTKGLRNWRTDMREEDITVFEAIAGDLLGELGYELSGLKAGDPAIRRIARGLEWWPSRRKFA